jgi:DNA-binding GntR family transcriptional regulator
VREALMRLADIGLVEMSPNRYTRVAPLDLRAIDEGVYTSGILLEYAVRQVVPTITNSTLSNLDRHVKEAKKHAKSKDLPALAMSVNEFFLEFERAADNRVLLAVSEGLSPQLLRYVTVWQLPFEVESLPVAIEAIASAAKERDADKAAELIRELHAPTRDQFLNEYRRTDEEIDANPIV